MRIIETHPLLPTVERGQPFEIEVDGETLTAYPGETIATAIMAAGRRLGQPGGQGRPARGVYCGIGLCFGCLVTVNEVAGVRACMTLAQPGMRIQTNQETNS